jgi:hypothetical protein
MRTTLTIEPAVAERLQSLMQHEGGTFKRLVNEALREGLNVLERGRNVKRARFTVDPHNFGLKAGIDPDKIGQFADDLEDQAIAARMREQ